MLPCTFKPFYCCTNHTECLETFESFSSSLYKYIYVIVHIFLVYLSAGSGLPGAFLSVPAEATGGF